MKDEKSFATLLNAYCDVETQNTEPKKLIVSPEWDKWIKANWIRQWDNYPGPRRINGAVIEVDRDEPDFRFELGPRE